MGSQVLERFSLTGESVCNCPAKINCMWLKGRPHLRAVRRLLASRRNLHNANPSPSVCWDKHSPGFVALSFCFSWWNRQQTGVGMKDGKATLLSEQCTGPQSLLPSQTSFSLPAQLSPLCFMRTSNYMAMYGSFLRCFQCITKMSG